MNERMDALLFRMSEREMDAAWIVSPENIRYLTGYTGEGCLVVAGGEAVILTDFRYVEQAARQSPGCRCLRTVNKEIEASDLVRGLLSDCGAKTLGFEPGIVTVAQYEEMKAALGDIAFVNLDGMVEALREIKDAGEIEKMQRASRIACAAFENMLGRIHPGMTEKQVQVELDYEMLRLGSEMCAFSTIACSGLNGSLPHAIPSDHVLQSGELLTMDFGAQVEGYKCDMTRTVAIGKISDELRAIYDTVLEAQLAALEAVRAGLVCKDGDRVARDIIDARYPGAFGHSLGHGVGLQIHEAPWMSRVSDAPLKSGHVVTVEPGVYIEGVGGCRIEDMVFVTDTGCVNAIAAPKQLIIL